MNIIRSAAVPLALLGAALSLPAVAAPESYTIDSAHTFPSYEVRHLGFSVQRGRFNSTSGKVVLDRAARTGSVDVKIDAASISTGNPALEKHLRSEEFFGVDKYPVISFKSTAMKFDGDKLASVEGNLTMHGVTRPVTLAVTDFRCAPHPMAKRDACGADAVTTVKRTDFGVSYAVPAVADEVKLILNIEAIKD
ncbi:MAG: YceI family protein [Zoogloea sp.]|nr:YceI family protein [Zoogloea sp.]